MSLGEENMREPPKKRILWVEDEADTREMITMLLSGQFAYEVTTARTLAHAVRLAQGERFDLYLLDYLLPDGTALDLCRRIREFDSATPVLIYPANVSFSRQQVIDAGGQGYVGKMDGIEALRQSISKLLHEGAAT